VEAGVRIAVTHQDEPHPRTVPRTRRP
jgi:hypothetical protein